MSCPRRSSAIRPSSPAAHDGGQPGGAPAGARHRRGRMRDDCPQRLSALAAARHPRLLGLAALVWLLLRTGSKPTRATYPCQQAALSTASLALGAPFVLALIAARRRARAWLSSPLAFALLVAGVIGFLGVHALVTEAEETARTVAAAPRDHRARVFHVTDCPADPAGDRFLGLDNLFAALGRGGTKLYRAPYDTPLAGPTGIVGEDDVVLIKINYQWDQRGGTNVDLLRGLIRRLVEHPEGFRGEIVVCENAQFASTQGFDRAQNNAQDTRLSPHDVVVAFQGQGHDVSHFDWTPLRFTAVAEYAEGDANDGYVVLPYDAQINGRVSYPKFRTPSGTCVSLRHGVWNPTTESYSRERLRFINLPVLKSHHAVYGATAAVKDYMGVVTRELSTNSHAAIRTGLLGAVLGEVGLADLNIIDAIWINADPYTGPGTNYSGATRRDELAASLDPVALDIWAVKNILVPGFLANGFTPPWPTPSADPDDPASAFRVYLDNSMTRILAAGLVVTNDLGQIDVSHGRGDAGDFDRDGDVDGFDLAAFADCFTGEGGGPAGAECAPADFDGDGDVDCLDWETFRVLWTEPGTPSLPECAASDLPPVHAPQSGVRLFPVRPNPASGAMTIAYTLASPGRVSFEVYDVGGRCVRKLGQSLRPAGENVLQWDGCNDAGQRVPPGVYSVRLAAASGSVAGKVVVR